MILTIIDVFVGLIAIIGMFVLLAIFLNWFSKASNTKFVSRTGRTIIDNTESNNKIPIERPKDKTEEQKQIEKNLRAEREKLFNKHKAQLNNLVFKEEQRILKEKEQDKIDDAKYKQDLQQYNERLKKSKESKESTINTEKERLLAEIDELDQYEPIRISRVSLARPTQFLSRKDDLERELQAERKKQRVLHSKQIQFSSELKRINFITTEEFI